MMKRTTDWKTAREKSSLLGTPGRFQHTFSSKPNQTTLPFPFPHMVTLRNPAQLTITATMLPTCGPQPQPLAGVAKISRPNPPTTSSPHPPAIPRAVRIVSPKPSSPQVPEKPPPLLPPLPGRSYVDIIDDDDGNDDDESDDDTSSSGSSSFDFTEEEIFEESQADIETQAAEVTSLITCKFPQHYKPTELFPATLMQAHHLIDMENFTNSPQDDMSLFSNKVDNIVRGMKVHGPLNVNLLSKALEQVTKLHHLLTLRVQHTEDYVLQALADKSQVNLVVTSDHRNELPGNIITQERRKPFSVHIKNDLIKPVNETLPAIDDMHITSVVDCDSDNTRDKMWPYQTLVRAKLIVCSPQDHLLVLTFSRLVCDYWSSCLFLQQLSQSYTQLEQGTSMNRLLTRTLREDSKAHFASLRQDSQHKLNRSFPGARTAFVHTATSKLQPIRQSSLPLSKKLMHHGSSNKFSLLQSPQLQFQQVAIREKELLTMMSKERLWSFWQGMVTAIIKRALGPSRMKVVPPVRLPSQLGEGKTRPKTSRARPLTARRNKVLTSDKNNPQLGPVSSFHFIKVEEAICSNFKHLFIEQGIKGIQQDEILHYMCLAGFVLLLGRCCRGWGPKYGLRKARPQTANLFDVGSFLIGIEVSLRQLMPEPTKGLIGPLTNNVAIRVNLSVCETFSDLVINLAKSVSSARNHSHFPFFTISHDHGMPAILPIKFSYLTQCDVKQLTNPQNFYFVETAVGVEGHGLARLGSNCYLTPINSKLDDSCYLELMMWESVESNVVGGGFRYHNHVIAPDIVGKLGREFCRLLAHAAEDPSQTLADLVQQINPPFSHHRPAYQMK